MAERKMTTGSMFENAVSEVKPKVSRKEKKPFLSRGAGIGGGKGCSGHEKRYKKAFVFTSAEPITDSMPPKVRPQPIENQENVLVMSNKTKPKVSERNDSVTKNHVVEERSESRSKVKRRSSNIKQRSKISIAHTNESTVDFLETKSKPTQPLKKDSWRSNKVDFLGSRVERSPSVEFKDELQEIPKKSSRYKKEGMSYFSDDSEPEENSPSVNVEEVEHSPVSELVKEEVKREDKSRIVKKYFYGDEEKKEKQKAAMKEKKKVEVTKALSVDVEEKLKVYFYCKHIGITTDNRRS
jgi:hypothetical protein